MIRPVNPAPTGLRRLLWPYARPYLGALVLVLILGMVTALAQQSAYLLVKPTWQVLFEDAPKETDEDISSGTEQVEPDGFGGIETQMQRAKEWAVDLVLGESPDYSDEGRRRLLLRAKDASRFWGWATQK